jgi:hypothetical protein
LGDGEDGIYCEREREKEEGRRSYRKKKERKYEGEREEEEEEGRRSWKKMLMTCAYLIILLEHFGAGGVCFSLFRVWEEEE